MLRYTTCLLGICGPLAIVPACSGDSDSADENSGGAGEGSAGEGSAGEDSAGGSAGGSAGEGSAGEESQGGSSGGETSQGGDGTSAAGDTSEGGAASGSGGDAAEGGDTGSGGEATSSGGDGASSGDDGAVLFTPSAFSLGPGGNVVLRTSIRDVEPDERFEFEFTFETEGAFGRMHTIGFDGSRVWGATEIVTNYPQVSYWARNLSVGGEESVRVEVRDPRLDGSPLIGVTEAIITVSDSTRPEDTVVFMPSAITLDPGGAITLRLTIRDIEPDEFFDLEFTFETEGTLGLLRAPDFDRNWMDTTEITTDYPQVTFNAHDPNEGGEESVRVEVRDPRLDGSPLIGVTEAIITVNSSNGG